MSDTREVQRRYNGIQSVLKVAGSEGCHFLVLCTIVEEHTGKPLDLIEAIRVAQKKNWISNDFYVLNDGTPFLSYFTGIKWTRKEVDKLPDIRDNDYTEAKWYNPRTGKTHFRRRYVDTLSHSTTVNEGYIKSYYIYTAEVV